MVQTHQLIAYLHRESNLDFQCDNSALQHSPELQHFNVLMLTFYLQTYGDASDVLLSSIIPPGGILSATNHSPSINCFFPSR